MIARSFVASTNFAFGIAKRGLDGFRRALLRVEGAGVHLNDNSARWWWSVVIVIDLTVLRHLHHAWSALGFGQALPFAQGIAKHLDGGVRELAGVLPTQELPASGQNINALASGA